MSKLKTKWVTCRAGKTGYALCRKFATPIYIRMEFFFIALLFLFFSNKIYSGVAIVHFNIDHQEKPIGIDISNPHFSWQMKASDNQRGYFQKAYQIIVRDSKGKIVWDTKKIISDLSNSIAYAGVHLLPVTRYTWKVTVWNNLNEISSNTSWFETGLMNSDPNLSAWSGAKWIGGGDDDLVLYAPYLSVFKIEYGIQLDKASASTKAAFVFGANDSRLKNKNLNLMQVENGPDQSYISLELDISDIKDTSGMAALKIYRVGYSAEDKTDVPFKTLQIPHSLISNANKYELHKVYVECNFGVFEFYIDGKDPAHKLQENNPGNQSAFGPRGINLNPVGAGNNFISFPMLAEIGFRVKDQQVARFNDLKIKNYRFPSNVLFSENLREATYTGIFKSNQMIIENGSYFITGNALIVADPSKNAEPMLRSVFNVLKKPVKKARLYVTARGIYEIYLNGQRISSDYFNPGLTQYNKHHMYQTYDITTMIKSGEKNAIGAWLSEGWWSGNITYSGESWNYFGDRQSLLSKLVITYADDSEQIIASNPKDWKFFNDGPIRYGSFFQGEVYDASKDKLIKDWTVATYDDHLWKPVVEVPLEGNSYMGTFTDFMGRKSTMDYHDMKLIGQMGENASIVKTMPALSVKEVKPGVWVYDMGQNMVGVPQIKIKNGVRGNKLTLRYAEVMYPDLPEYKQQTGMVMMENIRAELTQDIYILKGGDEIIQPRFTFHGYRFLEITGIDKAIPLMDIKGLVISSVSALSSEYETSIELVNKLWRNITWSLRSNFLSIPTDTPARNERMGWSGDISVFAKSATYLTNAYLFLRRHLMAMRDVQADNGRFTDVAPMGGGFGGTLWGSAGITVAWQTYQQYGDLQLLREHYTSMKKYLQFLETKLDKNTGILNEGPLGDWLSPEGNKNDNTLFWMAYYAYDLYIVSKAASLLGNNDDAVSFQKKRQEIKTKWNDIYVDKSTHKTIKSGMKTGFMGPPNQQQQNQTSDKGQTMDSQASYAIPLALDMFNDENKHYAIQYLNESIQRKNKDDSGVERPEYSLMTGFIGTASITEALSENGSSQTAYKLLRQKEYPSWLYSVVNGATSIWERLNSYTLEDGFGGNNSMNSFNHYSFGAVAAWMYNYSLGIQRSPDQVAFKKIILKPNPDPDKKMTWAKGNYQSVYGTIYSEWRYNDNSLKYLITIPANTTAALYLPPSSVDYIKENGKSIAQSKGIKYINQRQDTVQLELGSGTYSFEIN